MFDLWKRHPGLGLEIFSENNVYVLNENSYTKEHRSREVIQPGTFAFGEIPKPWYKAVFAWENTKLKSIETDLKGMIGNRMRTVFSESNLFDILHVDASKGHALEELCRITGQTCDSVIAIGDNLNDLDMIKTAGIGVAVANAHAELKKHATFCTLHNDSHAVAEVIKRVEKSVLEV